MALFQGCKSGSSPLAADSQFFPSAPSTWLKARFSEVVPQTILSDTCKASLTVQITETAKRIPADFFIGMPQYNTEQGLALSTVSAGFKDNLGNLWFGTFGAGVSRYDGKAFVNFSSEQGLANNNVTCITQDDSGNLWFGTSGGGASCYDGYRFVTYSAKEGLIGPDIRSIVKDKKGFLWFISRAGLSKGNPLSSPLQFKTYKSEAGFPVIGLNCMYEDRPGRFWIGTYGMGVLLFDGEKVYKKYTEADGLGSNRVYSILGDKSGNIWIGTENGISCLDLKTEKITVLKSVQDMELKRVSCCKEDKAGLLWFGCQNGVVCYNPLSGFSSFTSKQGLSVDDVRNITEDNEGNLWFGTFGGGICRFDGKGVLNYTPAQGLYSNFVFSLTEDRSGDLWMGSEAAGVIRFSCPDPLSKACCFTDFNRSLGLEGLTCISVTQDRSGDFWIGTLSKGVCRFSPGDSSGGKAHYTFISTAQGLVNNTVWSVLQDKDGSMWMATSGGLSHYSPSTGFCNYTVGHGLSSNAIRCITQDRSGRIWLGTAGNGIMIFDGKTVASYSGVNGFPYKNVWTILEDKNANIWIAADQGLLRCDARSVKKMDSLSVVRYTVQQGLPDNYLCSLAEDEEGTIWAGTNKGIAGLSYALSPGLAKDSGTVNLEQLLPGSNSLNNAELGAYHPVFEVYNQQTGYAIKDINTGKGGIFADSKGILWAATGDVKTGLVRFDQKALHKNCLVPSLAIQSIKINQRSVNWNDRDSTMNLFSGLKYDSTCKFYPVPLNLALPYDYNNISFEYCAIEPARANLINYQYLLEGYDKEWSPVLSKTSATFGNMHEGTYIFKLRAQSPEGIWCEPLCYAFTVRPPWFRTWWSIVLYLLSGLALFRFIIQRRTVALQNEKQVLERSVNERTVEVVKQKQLVDAKNLQITDSINYARYIQESLLLSEDDIKVVFPFDAFVFYQPKDIVSGDFYWFSSVRTGTETVYVVAAVDCTGHGVPGAFMSMIGNMLLNKIVNEKQITDPALILKEIQNGISDSLHRKNSAGVSQDGMDVSICVIDTTSQCMHYSGAMHPVYVVSRIKGSDKKEIEVIKPTTFSIGDRIWIWNDHIPKEVEFENHSIPLQKGMMIYLFSDGYRDQLKGAEKERLGVTRFRQLLFEMADLPLQEQKEKLKTELENWKGSTEQVDDILVIGVRI